MDNYKKDKYLIFSIGKESYGIDIKYVIEIIGIEPITEVPELPDYVRGVINLIRSSIHRCKPIFRW